MPCTRRKVPDTVDVPFIGSIDKGKLIVAGAAVGSGAIVLEPMLRSDK